MRVVFSLLFLSSPAMASYQVEDILVRVHASVAYSVKKNVILDGKDFEYLEDHSLSLVRKVTKKASASRLIRLLKGIQANRQSQLIDKGRIIGRQGNGFTALCNTEFTHWQTSHPLASIVKRAGLLEQRKKPWLVVAWLKLVGSDVFSIPVSYECP